MSDIFISYASADKPEAELLATALAQNGWSVWWDRKIPPGKSYDETIEDALNAARCVIVLWSSSSVKSRWVKTEAAEGAARGILVPALIEDVKIPLEFKRIEAADLSDWRGDPAHREFEQLLQTVGGMLDGRAPVAQRPPAAARLRHDSRRIRLAAAGGGLVIGFITVLYLAGFFPGAEKSRSQTQHPATAPSTPNGTPTKSARNGSDERAPAVAKPSPSAQPRSAVVNLLAAENGGHVIVATNDRWQFTIDGDEKSWQYIDIGVVGSWAVYGFKNLKPATFDTFKILIDATESWNLKEFELLAGNESPTGKFDSLGKFQTQNVRFQDPYQEFRFPPVKARYLKVRVVSSHGFSSVGVYEMQLFGVLEK